MIGAPDGVVSDSFSFIGDSSDVVWGRDFTVVWNAGSQFHSRKLGVGGQISLDRRSATSRSFSLYGSIFDAFDFVRSSKYETKSRISLTIDSTEVGRCPNENPNGKLPSSFPFSVIS